MTPANPPVRRGVATQPKPQPAPTRADDLGAATDEVNEAFAKAERAMRGLAVPGEVEVDTGDGVEFLVFAKQGQQWRLFHEWSRDNFGNRERQPIVSAPRAFRFAAAERLGVLIAALKTERLRQLEQARRAKLAIEDAIAELGPVAPDPSDEPPDFGDEDIPF